MKIDKIDNLEKIIKKARKMLIAFSGGVDSTFLLKKAVDAIGSENVIAVTARSEVLPDSDFQSALEIADEMQVNHIIIEKEELKNRNFVDNPPERCYYCKTELLDRLKETADSFGIDYVADGTNYSDFDDFRPGLKAIREKGAHSPLQEAGLTKIEIRQFSKELGLSTWDKPASPCLASRIPYGTKITLSILHSINEAEKSIKLLGVKDVRVRHEENTARIEVSPEQLNIVIDNKDKVSKKLKELGYLFVSLDLDGYNQGNLNKNLSQKCDGETGLKEVIDK